MARRIFLAFLSALLLSNAGAAQEPVRTLYCIETERQGMLWSIDHPLQSGEQVLFHQHPGGTLVSIRRSGRFVA